MASKNHNPGCPCCDCYDQTFTDDYSSFTTADGEYDTDRWVLASGEELKSGTKPSGGEAWFHTIHIKSGDCDLTWDGITFEYRDAGTITDGTNASIFMPGSVPSAGWEESDAIMGTYVTLWVTPDWYCVMISRRRLVASLDTNTRGSLQVIERDNSLAPKSLSVTAVGGDLEIASWRIADASVKVEGGYMYGEITRECPKPDRWPQCTERYFQSQQALLTALTWDHEIDRYEIIRIVGAGPGGSDLLECQFLDSTTGGLSLRLGDDLVTAWPDVPQRCDLLFIFLITGVVGSNQPNPESSASLSQNYSLPDSEPGSPYPKPRARYLFALAANVRLPPSACDSSAIAESESFVTFQADGKSPVQFYIDLPNLDINYFDCFNAGQCASGRDETSDPVLVLTRFTAEWVAE